MKFILKDIYMRNSKGSGVISLESLQKS